MNQTAFFQKYFLFFAASPHKEEPFLPGPNTNFLLIKHIYWIKIALVNNMDKIQAFNYGGFRSTCLLLKG